MLIYVKALPQFGRKLATIGFGQIAGHCHRLGHTVRRYSHRESLNLDADLAIIWNGLRTEVDILPDFYAAGGRTLFLELGFYPHDSTFQVDSQGVNAGASWCQPPLEFTPGHLVPVHRGGDLLTLLQIEFDTQLIEYSPYFGDQRQWLTFLGEHSELPIRLRRHPGGQIPPGIDAIVDHYGMEWDKQIHLVDALEGVVAVATINSSAAIEVMDCGVPVLCYGQAAYRHPHAVHCLDDSPLATTAVTELIASGESGLDEAAVEAMLDRVRENQYTLDGLCRPVDNILAEVES